MFSALGGALVGAVAGDAVAGGIYGMLGSLIDSILGALLQTPGTPMHGLLNSLVNLLSATFTMVAAVYIARSEALQLVALMTTGLLPLFLLQGTSRPATIAVVLGCVLFMSFAFLGGNEKLPFGCGRAGETGRVVWSLCSISSFVLMLLPQAFLPILFVGTTIAVATLGLSEMRAQARVQELEKELAGIETQRSAANGEETVKKCH